MRGRIILAAVALSLAIVTATLARPQAGNAKKPDQTQRAGQAPTGKATIQERRARVARLRAEVELLELEHEVDRTILGEILKEARDAGADFKRSVKIGEAINQISLMAASVGKFEEFRKEFGNEDHMRRQLDDELKVTAAVLQSDIDRRKRAFLEATTALHEKRLELAEQERRLAHAD